MKVEEAKYYLAIISIPEKKSDGENIGKLQPRKLTSGHDVIIHGFRIRALCLGYHL